ncbi:tyrosine-type recombinase/integrase [Agromyces albus]|uniref:tyrosine-type recombinase/integrase n=1 Tax=Agromyces albus TaxID=205332 RepID=UPI002788BB92|nr:site-specific integrase [Agromyces albus]MDQ0576475.1 integrase [Agromyces albus]
MGSIHSYETKAGKRYRIIFRTPDHSQTSERGFRTKRDAEIRLAEVEVSKSRGEFIDAASARATIATLGKEWLLGQEHVLKPSAYRPLESSWRLHVKPKWGHRAIGSVRHSEAQTWVSELSRSMSATSVLRAYGILAGILDTAVKDRRLASNTARGLTLPRKTGKSKVYLTHAQVQQLADASAYPALVLFLAYTGLRWGEATGLRVKHLNALRRRVSVEENAVMVGGTIHVGTPKSHTARSVPYPAFLSTSLAQLCEGKGRDSILFGDGATHMRLPHSRDGWFTAAVKRVQAVDEDFPRVTPHDLRHTAASLAISAGANVKAVQRMLGHASAAMTLDVYGDLFDDDLDAVAKALNKARSASSVAKALPRTVGGQEKTP